MAEGLLLVDLQADFAPPPEVLAAAGRLLGEARARGVPVWHVLTAVRRDEPDRRMRHWRDAGVWRCVVGTPGQASLLAIAPGERVVEKTVFSPFVEQDLAAELRARGVDRVIVAGVKVHACVRATALDAYQRGFATRLAGDAAGGDDPLHAAVTRRWLAARGVPSVDAPGDPGAVRRAVAEAGAAARAWRDRLRAERALALERAAAALRGDAEGLARLITEDVGKPIRYSRGEVARAAALLEAAVRHAAGDEERQCGARSTARRVPLGTIAAITPWNNPLAIPAGKLGPALIHGNAAVLKPSPRGARAGLVLVRALAAAGAPVTAVEGDATAAALLLEDGGIDGVSLTGSEAAGFAAVDACARRGLPLQAELGGNNAALVWEDADLDAAAIALAEGAFGFAGQRCTANRRIVVAAPVLEGFWERFARAVADLPAGDPFDEDTVVGPVIDDAAARRLRALVARAVPAARRVLQTPTDGVHLSPTVLLDPPADHEIVQEESFGPIAVVQTAADLEHAMHLVNGVRHGLAAALFARDPGIVSAFRDRARAGILKLNLATSDADADAPFGGWRASGIGPPEHGEAARDSVTRWQTLYR